MAKVQKILAVLLVALLAAALYLLWVTREPESARRGRAAKGNPAAESLVDQTPLLTALKLAKMPAAEEEVPFAKAALSIADKQMDQVYAAAKRELEIHPAPLTAEAKQIQQRLKQAEDALAGDDALVERLTAEEAKATGAKKEDLHNQLILAQANQQGHQDDVDDAKEDLARAGGDSSNRIEALTQEHEASSKVVDNLMDTLKATESGAAGQRGLIHRFPAWWAWHEKQLLLQQAKQEADSSAASLLSTHNALEAQLETMPGNAAASAAAAPPSETAPGPSKLRKPTPEQSVALKAAKERASDKKNLASLDKRMANQKDLAVVYGNWIAVVAGKQRAVLHRALIGLAVILIILLVGIFFNSWLEQLLGKLPLDRRQVQSLRTVSQVAVRVLAILLILLVVMGPPGQVGTFIGLATAGLTVALKDFIVGFIGWFVLMGKNGIRLGDWVEINGVTGEVVEIGPFHTVLLETGNWTDSGHPTGRRVTFTNSFAIEGHYFNFSTTGQWLWDELTLALPAGKETYTIVDAIRKKVEEETTQSGHQAEEEWRLATNSREMSGFSAAPAVSIKPVLGGVEVAIRYITRAHERYALRAKLNQAAVELLGR